MFGPAKPAFLLAHGLEHKHDVFGRLALGMHCYCVCVCGLLAHFLLFSTVRILHGTASVNTTALILP